VVKKRGDVALAQRPRTPVCRRRRPGLAPHPCSGKIPPFSRSCGRRRRTGGSGMTGRDGMAAGFRPAPDCLDAVNGRVPLRSRNPGRRDNFDRL